VGGIPPDIGVALKIDPPPPPSPDENLFIVFYGVILPSEKYTRCPSSY